MVQNRTCREASYTVEHSKQRQVKVDWHELLYFGSSAVQLASRHAWFCTTWHGIVQRAYSSRLSKGNHNRNGVWKPDLISIIVFLLFNFSFFSLVVVSIEEIYQTLKTIPDHVPNSSRFIEMLRCASYFQSSSWCLEMWWNTVFCVWNITYNINFAIPSSKTKLFMDFLVT